MPRADFGFLLDQFRRTVALLSGELGRAIVGQHRVIDLLLAAILARGHCLIVGVPGLAKTLLVSSLSKTLALSYRRVQFTPDLMPSDITGTMVVDEVETDGAGRRREFRFVPGPLFANLVLADEINRAPPKTQAALLEAMQERQVTTGTQSRALPTPFFVIATQNPIEQEGTYPLPEAQLDRFMFNVRIDYPSLEEEQQILASTTTASQPALRVVLSDRQLLNLQKIVASIPVSPYVISYAAALVRATRPSDPTAPPFAKQFIEFGAGPRAGQYLLWGAKALAAMAGRPAASCDDIRRCANPVLRHRIGLNFAAQAEGLDADALVARLLDAVPLPAAPKTEAPKPATAAAATPATPDPAGIDFSEADMQQIRELGQMPVVLPALNPEAEDATSARAPAEPALAPAAGQPTPAQQG